MEDTKMLIEEVKKYVFLFDTSHLYYKNVAKKAEAWNKISEELGITSELAKAKWKNLRDSYIRFKKSVKGETGQAKKYHKWPWSSHMEFLDDTLKFRPPSSNISDISIGSPSRPETPPQSSEIQESIFFFSPSTKQMLPPLPPQKKLKSHHEVNDVEKVIDCLQTKNKTQLDGADYLFLSYADTFKKFDAEVQAELKVELATLFAKTELREIRGQVRSIYNSDNSITSSPNSQYSFEPQSQPDNVSYTTTRDVYENASNLVMELGLPNLDQYIN